MRLPLSNTHTKKVPRFIRCSEGGGCTVKERHKSIPDAIANHPALSALWVRTIVWRRAAFVLWKQQKKPWQRSHHNLSDIIIQNRAAVKGVLAIRGNFPVNDFPISRLKIVFSVDFLSFARKNTVVSLVSMKKRPLCAYAKVSSSATLPIAAEDAATPAKNAINRTPNAPVCPRSAFFRVYSAAKPYTSETILSASRCISASSGAAAPGAYGFRRKYASSNNALPGFRITYTLF